MSFWARADDALYRFERVATAVCLAVMGVIVFTDVVHRVATRQEGLLLRLIAPVLDPSIAARVAPVLGFVLTALVCGAALRTRGVTSVTRRWTGALILAAVAWGAVIGLVWLLPNGLVWSQTIGLALMLWVGMIGASLATRERRHLALDIGPRALPERARPYATALGHLITSLFCLLLVILSVESVRRHLGDWRDTGGAGGVLIGTPIPKWVAFLAIPYGFIAMSVRFVAEARAVARGERAEGDSTLHMLGLGKLDKEEEHP
jgi:TRAP-type C4-dicarboxylate transport system permease small subunit